MAVLLLYFSMHFHRREDHPVREAPGRLGCGRCAGIEGPGRFPEWRCRGPRPRSGGSPDYRRNSQYCCRTLPGRDGPGAELFEAVEKAIGKPAIIAEDLGFIDNGVRELMKKTGFPGCIGHQSPLPCYRPPQPCPVGGVGAGGFCIYYHL